MGEQTTEERLSAIIREEPSNISREIHTRDPMNYKPDFYFEAGLIVLRYIRLALLSANATSPRRILDLPSGYGRILRMLKAAFPEAALTACDIRADAVDFCVQTFGATGVLGKENPDEVELTGPFDLIWCGSLLTHVDKDEWTKFLKLFERILSPGGIVMFTTFGRLVAEKRVRARNRPLSFNETQIIKVLSDYDESGFGFSDSLSQTRYAFRAAYGDSIVTPAWVCTKIANAAPSFKLLLYTEGGWGGRNEWAQDIIACEKARD
jgi:SAM-dependent methyltransferase